MSFTSALPANLPKYSAVVGVPTVIVSHDRALGIDSVFDRYIELSETGIGVEASKNLLPVYDAALGSELLSLYVKAREVGSGQDVISYVKRAFTDRGTGSDYVKLRFLETLDKSTGRDSLTLLLGEVLPDPFKALSECVDYMNKYYGEIDYNRAVKSDHYNIVAQCASYALSLTSYWIHKLSKLGVVFSPEILDALTKCWNTTTRWEGVKSLDIILPEHENMLIEIVKCLDELYSKLTLVKLLRRMEIGVPSEPGRYLEITPIIDRITYKVQPIEYYTDKLTRPGGYVLTPPPTHITAQVSSLKTREYGFAAVLYNVTQGTRVTWTSISAGRPCGKAYLYFDGWIVMWFEDRCLTGKEDWDYDDVGIGFRVEVLNGAIYVHFLAFQWEHTDTDKLCVIVKNVEYCSPELKGYSGAVKASYEAWIRVQ